MRLETIDDALAWIQTLEEAGVTTLPEAAVLQVWRLLAKSLAATQATQAALDYELGTLRALGALEQDLAEDALRRAYTHGYHTGFAEAQTARWETP
jgi:hypothetical protein